MERLTAPELKEGVEKAAKDMKSLIVNCGKNIDDICKELEEIYDLDSQLY